MTVPEGVTPGRPFALIANGQRVMVTCPQNVRPGQKIRFQLPIQLNQNQLESYKVSYDKDGWMRCLGTDMLYHWVYNKSESKQSTDGYHSDVDAEESKQTVAFDIEQCAYVRRMVKDSDNPESVNQEMEFIPATEYAVATTVKNTSVNYDMLSRTATRPFPEKVEWFKEQFNALQIGRAHV